MPEPKQGIITETPSKANGYCYTVTCDDESRHQLRGLGAPQGGQVGDTGTLTYTTGANFGLWFWSVAE